jgi:hypothetical protein
MLDLSLYDIYLWGYLKDRVYESNPKTLEDIPPKLSTAYCQNLGWGYKKTVKVKGQHTKHIVM